MLSWICIGLFAIGSTLAKEDPLSGQQLLNAPRAAPAGLSAQALPAQFNVPGGQVPTSFYQKFYADQLKKKGAASLFPAAGAAQWPAGASLGAAGAAFPSAAGAGAQLPAGAQWPAQLPSGAQWPAASLSGGFPAQSAQFPAAAGLSLPAGADLQGLSASFPGASLPAAGFPGRGGFFARRRFGAAAQPSFAAGAYPGAALAPQFGAAGVGVPGAFPGADPLAGGVGIGRGSRRLGGGGFGDRLRERFSSGALADRFFARIAERGERGFGSRIGGFRNRGAVADLGAADQGGFFARRRASRQGDFLKN